MTAATSALARVRRVAAFARYMPMRKLLARVKLDVRRRVRDRFPATMPVSAVALGRSGAPPLPLFPARAGLAPQDGPDGMTFTFLHRPVVMPGPGIDWNAPGPTAADQLWRMNLHYMEYLETIDDAGFAAIVTSWIKSCPAGTRGAWRDSWNSYALSLRAVVWMQQLAVRRGRLPGEAEAAAYASLSAQLRFLAANLETDLGGNHLIKNIKALLWASAFFDGPDAASWRKTGLALLAQEIGHQVLPDGCHDERSASYHAQVFADLLECRHALGHDPLNGRLDATLTRMAQAVADLAHPDGGPVLFNDSGLTMAYAPQACLDAFERLIGPRPSPRTVFAYPDAGYFGQRTRESYVVADCGRIAPDDLPAHGHGDVLSFELSVAGERMIVDQGVYEYIAGPKRRTSRAASSHNTLALDGADQADFFGSFRCGRRPNVSVVHYAQDDTGFVLEGSHDGFAYLPGQPRHVRRFDVQPGKITINDTIEGTTDRPAVIGFLLHPGVEATVSGNRAELVRGAARVVMTSSHPFEKKDAVWWPDMGRELPAVRIVVALSRDSTFNRTVLEFERRRS